MELLRAIGEWIYHFQTLITGVAAVGAALWTIIQVRKQIEQVEKHRKNDLNEKIKNDVQIFLSEFNSMSNGVFIFYKRIKGHIPPGFTGQIWTVVPHLFELDEKELSFSQSSLALFKGNGGGEIITKLYLLQVSRNRLANSLEYFNQLKSDGHSMLKIGTNVDEETGGLFFTFDPKNVDHVVFDKQAEDLVSSMIFAAEEQINDIIDLTPKLNEFISNKLGGQKQDYYSFRPEYLEWFLENSSTREPKTSIE